MPKDLERDLGLYATITISIGAMIGSGIFVLPGLASKMAGPAVILAYFLAGLLVLPAALSKAEMATAMPEAGGTYLYIDRAMGPLPGTIAGVGAWFSLVFKSAFALVGLGSYLLLFVNIPADTTTLVALGLGVLLLVVNVVGVKQSGRLQAIIVSVVLLSLVAFIADGITFVERTRYHPFFPHGPGGLFAATGFVFVSYAGVTKIASVAEEVENPGRNIPIGIIASVLVMMLVYTLVIFVVIGLAPAAELATSLTPMALAARELFQQNGELLVAVVAVLALTSMANAGILSSSRFPLAMSRDDLAPGILGEVHDGFRTPTYAIAFTGALLLALIAFVDVVELAKLASAFKILVFALVNAALIAFRESELRSYDPEFVAPGYPWVQLLGILGGFALLTQMGWLPLLGAAGILVGGAVWYRVYGRERTDREGAALDAIRRRTGDYSVEMTREQLATGGEGGVLVAVGPETSRETLTTLLGIAAPIVRRRGGSVTVARFEEVPDQTTLSTVVETRTDADAAFEARVEDAGSILDVPIRVEQLVCHDVEKAVANYVDTCGANFLLGEFGTGRVHGEMLGHDVDWYMRNVDCDVAFARDRGIDRVDEVTVIADEGPYTPLEVLVADAIAFENGASIRFLYAVDEAVSDEQVDAIEAYHDRVSDLCSVPTERVVIRSDDRVAAIEDATTDADLAVLGTSAHHVVYDVVFGALPDRIADRLDCTVLLVHESGKRRSTFIRYLLDRFVF